MRRLSLPLWLSAAAFVGMAVVMIGLWIYARTAGERGAQELL